MRGSDVRTWLIAIISSFIRIDFANACFGELSVERSKDTIMGEASTAYRAFSIRLFGINVKGIEGDNHINGNCCATLTTHRVKSGKPLATLSA